MLPVYMIAAACASQYGVLTLSGETVGAGTAEPSTATAGVRFNPDGTVDKNVNLVYSQIDNATDWIIPNDAASSVYEVRATNIAGDALSLEAAAENVWVAISAVREWNIARNTIGTYNTTIDFEIRKGSSGGAQATGSYTLNLTIL